MSKLIFSEINLRRHRRFFPRKSAFIVFSPGFTRGGPLINIGKNGLACLYFIERGLRIRNIDRYVNIRCDSFTLGDVPFKIVEDSQLTDAQQGGSRIIRKRSIEFTGLSSLQKKRIDYFIETYTKEPLTGPEEDSGFPFL